MTLQLVLPNPSADDPSGLDSNFHCWRLDWHFKFYSFPTDASGVQYRRSRPASRTASVRSVIESKSPGFINTRLVNYNRGVSYQPSFHTPSQYNPEAEKIPPPSTSEEKSKMTRLGDLISRKFND